MSLSLSKYLYLSLSILFGHVMSSHHSEQMSQRSQVSRIALRRCSQNAFVFVFVFAIVFVIAGSVSLDGNTFPGTRSPLRDKLSFVLLSMLVSS